MSATTVLSIKIKKITEVTFFMLDYQAPPELRTLQRRLKKLKEQGLITLSGKANSARYYLVQKEESRESQERGEIIPLSSSGRQVLELVSRPGRQRQVVGYQRHFLEVYRPNIDSYLSE